MKTVRFTPVLAGATALALIAGTASFAQQASDPAQQPAQAQAQGQPADQLAALGQQLQQARQALEQQDVEQARQALQQLSDSLDQAMQNADDQTRQALEDIQSKLQQAMDGIEAGDAETARVALDDVEMSMQTAGIPTGQGDAGQQQASGQTQGGQQQPADQQQASGQQVEETTIKAEVVTVPAGESQQTQAGSGQMTEQSQVSQDAIWQAQDLLAQARQDLESAMQAVQEAEAALQQAGPGMAQGQGNANVTVVGSGGQQTDQAATTQGGQMPQRLSVEETTRLLSLGGREVAPASQMADLSVADLQDRDVLTMDGQEIGEVDQLVSNNGQVYAIIAHGGFLGIGEDKVAIPADRLGLRGDQVILLGLTEDQLKQLPEYEFGAGQEMGDEETVQIGLYE